VDTDDHVMPLSCDAVSILACVTKSAKSDDIERPVRHLSGYFAMHCGGETSSQTRRNSRTICHVR
jgi:hypothetical protein